MNSAIASQAQGIPVAFRTRRQFANWFPKQNGEKVDKIPCDPLGRPIDVHDPKHWITFDQAAVSTHGLAFVFTENDPFFFVDIDKAIEGGQWTTTALQAFEQFPGAWVERSQSGHGLHIFGSQSGVDPSHQTRRSGVPVEIYTHSRFVALTCDVLRGGDVAADYTPHVRNFLTAHGLAQARESFQAPDGADPAYTGPARDEDLIKALCAAPGSHAAMFGDKCHPRDLWHANEPELCKHFPAAGARGYDHSAADASLMWHLAFWTGRDMSRMQRLFERSPLYRPEKYAGKGGYRLERILDRGCTNERVYDKLVASALPPTPLPSALRHYREGNQLPRQRPELIKRLMPSEPGLVSFIAGQSGAGKTFYAAALAVALAGASSFLGMPVRENVGVIYIAKEGSADIDERIFSAKRAAGLEGKQLAIEVIPGCPDLMDEGARALLVLTINDISADMVASGLCTRVGVTIMDTLSVCFGMDENDTASAVQVCLALKSIGEQTGTVVCPIHHYGKDKSVGMRGSSAWRDNCDHMVTVMGERDHETHRVTDRKIAVAKARNGPEGIVCGVEIEETILGETLYGEEWKSAFLKRIEGELTVKTNGRPNKNKNRFDTAFDFIFSKGPTTQIGEFKAVDVINVRTEFIRSHPSGEESAKRVWRRTIEETNDYSVRDGMIWKTMTDKRTNVNFFEYFPKISSFVKPSTDKS